MRTRLLLAAAVCVGALPVILLVRTIRFTPDRSTVEALALVSIDESGAARRLADAVRFQTVTHENASQFKAAEFLGLHEYLKPAFPGLHSTLTREVVGDYSLLYTWKGSSEALKPILLMGHMDVVPAPPASVAEWTHPPFEGRIADGFIWGRGTMDDKFAVMSIVEAVEMLANEGFQPRRTIYLAFGHDEEGGGHRGAARIAALLRERRIAPEYVLDEGMGITERIVPDIERPVALIGLADKGFLSLELTVDAASGHSSMPPPQTAIGILSTAVSRLEERQMPASLRGLPRLTLETLGREMPFGKKLVMANLWLFRPLVERRLLASPATSHSIRTTTATTMIGGGVKENVLPTSARAVLNFRLMPGDSSDRVIAHVKEVVDDPRVAVRRFGGSNREPAAVSDANSAGFRVIGRTLRQVFPEALVAPALGPGGTDAKYFEPFTPNVYRFSPLRLKKEDLARLHGVNERSAVKDYTRSVQFYYHLIRHSAQ